MQQNSGLSEQQQVTGNVYPSHNSTGKTIASYPPKTNSLDGILDWQATGSMDEALPLDIPINRAIKRSFDILISFVSIVGILSWSLPLLALLIKIDSRGPVFFLQKRTKRNGGFFTCIKLRTMIVNAEADKLPASEADERITGLGRFLRNHYLDELPQFFNVIWGDMSVIGPRPHMVMEDIKYEKMLESYRIRHAVKPGITGLAQVMGLVGPTDTLQKMKDRVLLDISYINNWSCRLDFKIIYRTLLKVMKL
jgi:putative colanic acid biosynthesis UDP-glucose lipid carrier transferase